MGSAISKTAKRAATAAAERWLDSATWRVAVMRGTRVLPALAGEDDDLPPAPRMSMRLYAKGCPRSCMREVLEVLASRAEVPGPKADGVIVPGTWTHRFAAWNKDAGTQDSDDSSKTLIWELGDGISSFDAEVENGCGSRTTIRYEFDRADIGR